MCNLFVLFFSSKFLFDAIDFSLREFFRLLVECVDHFAHIRNCFQCTFVCFIDSSLFEDNQNTFALVQNAAKFFV